MPTLIKAVVQIAKNSGITADTVDNDFYFVNTAEDEVTPTLADGLRDALVGFYNDVHAPSTVDVASFLSQSLSRTSGACAIKFYSVERPGPAELVWGSPKQSRNWTLDAAAGGGNPMPNEVACVLTFHGDLEDIPETAPAEPPATGFIRPAARRRGRIYLGPLTVQTVSSTAPGHEPFPTVNLVNALCDSGIALVGDMPADTTWVVHSVAENSSFAVEGGWVDNAYDTQRRRGNDATARTSWSA